MKFCRTLALTSTAWLIAPLMSAPIIWMALTAFKTDLDALQLPPKLLFQPTLANVRSANANLNIARAFR